jgi:hypothetical protein
MVSRVFRAALFAGLVLALWAFARPASAATLAPFCDDRGATALASPPALEDPTDAVEQAAAPPSCDEQAPPGQSLAPAHRTFRTARATVLPVRTTPALAISPPQVQPLDLVEPVSTPQAGVHVRVERPPRG